MGRQRGKRQPRARCFQSTFQSQAHREENWQEDEKSCQVREKGSCFGQEIRHVQCPPLKRR
jgi:hypothetical protein